MSKRNRRMKSNLNRLTKQGKRLNSKAHTPMFPPRRSTPDGRGRVGKQTMPLRGVARVGDNNNMEIP